MLLFLTLPALGAIANHPELYHSEPSVRETCYGILLKDYLPVGFLGIALAALLAAVMSTIDSHMNYGAQTLLNDVYKPIFGEPGTNKSLWIGRFLMVVILLSSVAVVYFSNSLIGIAIVLAGLFGSSATFGWGLWWWWRVNLWSWIGSFFTGPVIYLGLGKVLGNWDWWQTQCSLSESSSQGMAMLQAVISMVITTVIWVIITLFTKPIDMEILKDFYRKAKPLGCWGPVKKAVEEEDGIKEHPKHLILGGVLVSFLGAAWIALAVLSISVIFVGRYGEAILYASLSLMLAMIFKKLFKHHIERIE